MDTSTDVASTLLTYIALYRGIIKENKDMEIAGVGNLPVSTSFFLGRYTLLDYDRTRIG